VKATKTETPEIVIALYRPHAGQEAALKKLIAAHLPTLRKAGLVTERAPVLAKARDGTYVEIFEWRAADSAALAHHHPEVSKLWAAMGEVCDMPTLSTLVEVGERFPHFQPVTL
jgi:hypothetical protein